MELFDADFCCASSMGFTQNNPVRFLGIAQVSEPWNCQSKQAVCPPVGRCVRIE